MTLQQMIETIQQEHPGIEVSQIIIDINNAYKEFCNESRVYRASYNLALTTAVSYNLASDVQQVYAINCYDSAGDAVSTVRAYIDNGVITFANANGTPLETFPTDIATVTIKYYKIPAELSSKSDSPVISSMYHQAIVERVLAKYYKKVGNQAAYAMCMNEYNRLRILAKKESNINKSTLTLHDINL